MKLKLERFEGLSCLSIRGHIDSSQHKILEVGVSTICKSLEEALVINLTLAQVDAATIKFLVGLKKKVATLSKFKIHWITPVKEYGDFSTFTVFTSRMTGSKVRHIGERIQLEDEVYALRLQVDAVTAKTLELGGDQHRTEALILENKSMKVQERVLKESIHWQEERMKLQEPSLSADPEFNEKLKSALAELHKLDPNKVDL